MTRADAVIAGATRWTTLVGDVRETLRSVPDGCAQTCVTSPPYWLQRDYGADGQIGQEPTPEAFAAALVDVFREVRRALRDDGTLWCNIGDTYAGASNGYSGDARPSNAASKSRSNRGARANGQRNTLAPGLKEKDLVGVPWLVAFALRASGWFLRGETVWSKPNAMPENVTDRPTRSHEHVFLLSKSPRYFYDAAAIEEQGRDGPRNARSVWEINAGGFAGAHFATMPPDLARRCILAGSRRGDIVLDPFGGAGTTALAALQHGRRALLCELNPEYVEIQRRRLAIFAADTTSPIDAHGADFGPLFGGAA